MNASDARRNSSSAVIRDITNSRRKGIFVRRPYGLSDFASDLGVLGSNFSPDSRGGEDGDRDYHVQRTGIEGDINVLEVYRVLN